MKVKALQKGYDGKQIREPGDVFEFEGKLGKWMEPVDKKAKAEAEEIDEVEESAELDAEVEEHAEEEVQAPAPKKGKGKKK